MARVRAESSTSGPGQAAKPPTDGETIARMAYELYEQRGRADGQAFDDWLQAEAIVRQRQAGVRAR